MSNLSKIEAPELAKLREETLTVLQDMDTDNELTPEGILDAIIARKIPHVEYRG